MPTLSEQAKKLLRDLGVDKMTISPFGSAEDQQYRISEAELNRERFAGEDLSNSEFDPQAEQTIDLKNEFIERLIDATAVLKTLRRVLVEDGPAYMVLDRSALRTLKARVAALDTTIKLLIELLDPPPF